MFLNFYSYFMILISEFGSNLFIFLFTLGILVITLCFEKNFKEALFLTLTPPSYFYSVFLKSLFKIDRPSNTPNINTPRFNSDLYGFPSSHTVFYTVFWGYLIYLSFKSGVFKQRYVKWVIRLSSLLFLIFVGPSRIYLGYHSVEDVFAGYFFGLVYLGSLIILDQKIHLKKQKGTKVFPKNQK